MDIRFGEQWAVRASGGQDLYLFAPTAEGVTARMFDSEFGIGEDPATGSAAGPLGAYLAEYGGLGKTWSVTIRQGEQVGRPSELYVEVDREGGRWPGDRSSVAWRVRVGGGVHIVGRGAFEL